MKNRCFSLLLSAFLSLLALHVSAQHAVIYQADTALVNAQIKAMSLDQKIGQLFMVAAYSNRGEEHQKTIEKLIQEEQIGGLIFFQGDPQKQAVLTNRYQMLTQTPLLIGMDAEWGLAMRLEHTFKYPWPLTVGALRDTVLSYEMGRQIGEQCRRLGVHINFAPVVDINTNPDNPIINARSFGENPARVVGHARAYMNGLQSAGVLACAKHFPGHGDTDQDSHKTLPTLSHSLQRLDEVELYPYRKLAQSGLASVMVAHLNVPALATDGRPTSLSKPTLDFLRQSLQFDGLVITDALNMQGVARQLPPGIVDLEALKAGNDILLFPENIPVARQKIKQALQEGQLTEVELNAHLRRILLAKAHLGLYQEKPISLIQLREDLNPAEAEVLNQRIFAQATTVLINHNKTLPILDLSKIKIACVTAGTEEGTNFVKTLKHYAKVDHYSYTPAREELIMNALSEYDLVIMGLYTSNQSPWKPYRIDDAIKRFIRRLDLQNRMVLNLFANPYALNGFPEAEQADALMISYQNHPDAESTSAQIIFGALGAEGRLPVSSGTAFEEGFGLHTEAIGRMGYVLPEQVGVDRQHLDKVDSIMEAAIKERATPGGQILIARHGKVFYQKNFGHHTYAKERSVSNLDLYDIASVTKIASTVPMLMRLVEQGRVDLDKTVGTYLLAARGTNKDSLVLRNILAHQARLQPWIPFYLETMDEGVISPRYYRRERAFQYPNVVTAGLFSRRSIRDTILKRVLDSELRATKEYKYSDLGYYLFMQIIEKIEGRPLNELAQEYLYRNLGAYSMTYQPLEVFTPEMIVPTERDQVFRKCLVHGYVHDQGAALLGGVAGHAGLFANANDLAKLMQMYLQKGTYAGLRYYDSLTVQEFTRCQFCEDDNRRGIGFDKPQLEGEGPTCGCLSKSSFGHSGFTGTLAWADPEEELIYIFLSNRVYPDADNRKLITLSTRTKIQEAIYEALEKSKPDLRPLLVGYH